MGNCFKLVTLCFGNDAAIPDNFSNVPGLRGPNGKIIQTKGLRLDFKVKQVYKSRLIQIEFISNLSGEQCTVHKCLHISNLPVSAKSEEIEEAFKQSTKNILYISEDNSYYYEGQVTVSINDVDYDFGEYLGLRSFARFQTISRPVSPSKTERKDTPRFEHLGPANFPIRINLTRDVGEPEANEFIQEKKIVLVAGVPVNSSDKKNSLVDVPIELGDSSSTTVPETVNSPKTTEHAVSRSIDKLEIIENNF